MYVSAIQRLLTGETWARQQLQAHAGKTLTIRAFPFKADLRITAHGEIVKYEDHSIAAPATLELIISPAALPLLLAGRQSFEQAIETRGDAEFARTLGGIAATLPWILEKELARWTGPIVAQTVSMAIAKLFTWPQYAAERLTNGFTHYWLEESSQLVKSSTLEEFSNKVDQLHTDTERLVQSFQHLQQRHAISK